MTNEAKKERPVIIHRALLGSVERMMGVLTEHFAAKWPFWLSPRQVRILTVSSKFDEYATSVQVNLNYLMKLMIWYLFVLHYTDMHTPRYYRIMILYRNAFLKPASNPPWNSIPERL